jgi:hypothetical protein
MHQQQSAAIETPHITRELLKCTKCMESKINIVYFSVLYPIHLNWCYSLEPWYRNSRLHNLTSGISIYRSTRYPLKLTVREQSEYNNEVTCLNLSRIPVSINIYLELDDNKKRKCASFEWLELCPYQNISAASAAKCACKCIRKWRKTGCWRIADNGSWCVWLWSFRMASVQDGVVDAALPVTPPYARAPSARTGAQQKLPNHVGRLFFAFFRLYSCLLASVKNRVRSHTVLLWLLAYTSTLRRHCYKQACNAALKTQWSKKYEKHRCYL